MSHGQHTMNTYADIPLLGGSRCGSSLRVAPSSFIFRCRGDGAEHAIGFIVGTGCEIERVGARIPAAAQGHGPQPGDHDGAALAILEGAEASPVGVESMYAPIAEIAAQDVAAEPAKGE